MPFVAIQWVFAAWTWVFFLGQRCSSAWLLIRHVSWCLSWEHVPSSLLGNAQGSWLIQGVISVLGLLCLQGEEGRYFTCKLSKSIPYSMRQTIGSWGQGLLHFSFCETPFFFSFQVEGLFPLVYSLPFSVNSVLCAQSLHSKSISWIYLCEWGETVLPGFFPYHVHHIKRHTFSTSEYLKQSYYI